MYRRTAHMVSLLIQRSVLAAKLRPRRIDIRRLKSTFFFYEYHKIIAEQSLIIFGKDDFRNSCPKDYSTISYIRIPPTLRFPKNQSTLYFHIDSSNYKQKIQQNDVPNRRERFAQHN